MVSIHYLIVKDGKNMELNINSPAYYSKEYGVCDDIYRLCRDISEYVREKKYSEIIKSVGIVPIIAPYEILQSGLFKEQKKCEVKYGFASVSIQIDFNQYVEADIEGKKKLIIKNILASMKSIQKKGSINYVQFEKDIIEFCKKSFISM